MYTSQDCVEYLLDSTGGGAQDSYHRAIRSAVHHAYRDLITARDWRWYETADTIQIDKRLVRHTLPWGTQSIDAITMSQPTGYDIMGKYVHPRDFQRILDQEDWNELIELVWTVAKSEIAPDRYELRILSGYGYTPGEATLTYRRRPRDLRLTGFEPTSRIGSVEVIGSEIIGTGTAFNAHMSGAIIRFSDDRVHHPESLTGLHPYVGEALIYAVASPTKLYAWSPVTTNFAATKYTVSDYLDISPGMYSALLSGAEVWLARLMGKNIEGAVGIYGRDLRLAFESDAVAVLSGRDIGYGGYLGYWYLRPGFDQGVAGPGVGGPNEDGTCPIKNPLSGGDADSDTTGEFSGQVSGGNAASRFSDCGDPA